MLCSFLAINNHHRRSLQQYTYSSIKMKILVLVLLLVSSLLLCSSLLGDAAPTPAVPAPTPAPSSCNALCNKRCIKAKLYDRCFKYCCICCDKCECVPSGTYGNKSECPCYRDMVNSKGKPKCP